MITDHRCIDGAEYRDELIRAGLLFPLSSRPTLWLDAEGERRAAVHIAHELSRQGCVEPVPVLLVQDSDWAEVIEIAAGRR